MGFNIRKGVKSIADYRGATKRAARYLIDAGRLPAWKTGRTWKALEKSIDAGVKARERAAMAE